MKKIFALVISSFLVLAGCASEPEFGEVSSAIQDSQEMQAEAGDPAPAQEDEVRTPPSQGVRCSTLGETALDGAQSFECRYFAGMELAWQAVSNTGVVPLEQNGAVDLENCKIQDQRKRSDRFGGATSFPMTSERMRVDGQIDLAIVPIDFPNSKAEISLDAFLSEQIEAFNEMFEMWAGENEDVKWHIPSDWLEMPRESRYYQWDHSTVQQDGTQKLDVERQKLTVAEQQFDVFSAAAKEIDLDQVDYAFIIANPQAEDVYFAPYSGGGPIVTDSGTFNFPHYGFGSVITGDRGRQLYHFLFHEMLHFRGLAGHAPGNEFPYNIMTAGETLFAWDAFLLGWQAPSQLLCFDSSKLEKEAFYLGSMEVESEGPRGAIIRVSDTKVLVVESRRKGRFNYSIPDGFAGVQVYLVDSTRLANRYDGNIFREEDYFAYHLRIDAMDHKAISQVPQTWVAGYPDLNETAFVGDSFTFGDIQVVYLEGGEFDKVEIRKIN